ncbi:MAG: LamG domain-containing protein [Deltaproteobacteria bacterium]|nr:LamG domain-containing protein [Deltaproteobacteria bacterium]
MAYPWKSLSDTFNRADEDPLSGGGNWTAPTGSNVLALSGNEVKVRSGLEGAWARAIRTDGPFQPTQWSKVRKVTTSAYVPAVIVNGSSGTTGFNGYECDGEDWMTRLRRWDDGSSTLLSYSEADGLKQNEYMILRNYGPWIAGGIFGDGSNETLVNSWDVTYSDGAPGISAYFGYATDDMDDWTGGDFQDTEHFVDFGGGITPKTLMAGTAYGITFTTPRKGYVSEVSVDAANTGVGIKVLIYDAGNSLLEAITVDTPAATGWTYGAAAGTTLLEAGVTYRLAVIADAGGFQIISFADSTWDKCTSGSFSSPPTTFTTESTEANLGYLAVRLTSLPTETPNNWGVMSETQALWLMEDSADPVLDETANNNDLADSDSGPTYQDTHKVQGSFSINFATTYCGLEIPDGSLSASFPGKSSGSVNKGYSIGLWVRLNTLTYDMGLFNKDLDGNNRVYGVRYDAPRNAFVAWNGYNSPYMYSTVEAVSAKTDIAVDTWYLVVLTLDWNDILHIYVGAEGDQYVQWNYAPSNGCNMLTGNFDIQGEWGSNAHVDEMFVTNYAMVLEDVNGVLLYGFNGDRGVQKIAKTAGNVRKLSIMQLMAPWQGIPPLPE